MYHLWLIKNFPCVLYDKFFWILCRITKEPIICTYGKFKSQFWQSNASDTLYIFTVFVTGNKLKIAWFKLKCPAVFCVLLSLIQTCTPNSHLYRMTSTSCHIDTMNSLDDGHVADRNMSRIEINIHEKELCIKFVIKKDCLAVVVVSNNSSSVWQCSVCLFVTAQTPEY